ncbi:hypothetical protein [Streptodolium elevatio]|uniref:DUF222 domain-containing protein n=1 Tax=Streptodolium elevatio TaxID=3157996 RepID=A0ABV3DIA7_9ACTN
MSIGADATWDAIVHGLDDPELRAQCQRDLMLRPVVETPRLAEAWAGVAADLAAAKQRAAEIAAHLREHGTLPDELTDATDTVGHDAEQARRLGRGAA